MIAAIENLIHLAVKMFGSLWKIEVQLESSVKTFSCQYQFPIKMSSPHELLSVKMPTIFQWPA